MNLLVILSIHGVKHIHIDLKMFASRNRYLNTDARLPGTFVSSAAFK